MKNNTKLDQNQFTRESELRKLPAKSILSEKKEKKELCLTIATNVNIPLFENLLSIEWLKREGVKKKCISPSNCFNHIWNASNIPSTGTVTKVLNLPFSEGGAKLDSSFFAFPKDILKVVLFYPPREKWMYFWNHLHTFLIIWFSLKDLLFAILGNGFGVVPIYAYLTSYFSFPRLEWSIQYSNALKVNT